MARSRRQLASYVIGLALCASACASGADDELGDPEDEIGVDVEEAIGDGVCFPGFNGDGSQCWTLLGDPFNDGINNDAYYTLRSHCPGMWGVTPIAYFRYWKMDREAYVARNFKLKELARVYTSNQYLLLQPHAVKKLQSIRDELGALTINSGYRPPGYNYTLTGSAGCSRHMYGDGFDIRPINSTLNQLFNECRAQKGWAKKYPTYVHCDFRDFPEDSRMFASVSSARTGPRRTELEYTTDIVVADGVLTAPADGFDEGEPMREWTAYDADGNVVAEGEGAQFEPPPQATSVSVLVGGIIEANIDLSPGGSHEHDR